MARALGLRTSHFTPLIIYIHFVTGQYFGEWLPIPNEVAFKRFNIDAPRYVHRIAPVPDIQEDKNIEDLKRDAIKLVQPQKFLGEFSVKKFGLPGSNMKEVDEIHETHILGKCENKGVGIYCQNDEVKTKHNDIKNATSATTRTAKKLEYEEKNSTNVIEDQPKDTNISNSDKKISLPLPDEENFGETNSYAVTENSEPAEDFKFSTTETKGASGYIYNRPIRIQNPVQTNFTQKFLEILKKYNIHQQDKLPNYVKSRISNFKTMNSKIVYLPLPLRVLERYNSFNHLPIDPLLAVFLSNYGYYLPRTYGSVNEYRNLYGYLASNNIHNNKPFGLYKIFSDTDSSSK